ncbi:3-carboxy-cis,cis-muconate cycloisomerase [Undibacterium sp. RTI2.1]|uniref:3-carboxy-cis,cis-muconate cycloisomerase n=1 Tax=unclassified Undibacterium TaxID=2630295 RepID=UPI002AB3D779|nr:MULTISPECIES: 3-carboxy-cis,cis-muconate cycloisomerase [unclassified Undibacterium]MDY7540238.1 3-carboxy-cis,cis-muconate cycloisomerase [Undibacterium sp. 5I1]MEB0031101.1 3-carboxy-cis,cis-muconate cycloisomerase [Undibacterium sp. RTI2.1]MEB0115307.1 3-carboxy-cis,cis-muconate cycloisomerase [Undibacterium sp. RTI2.2]MEB0231406.1 3-carboxy-cis,cis-muconate cycloisomerase [Undibacterium sp. 10I3]MEB0257165.1 3-carboxy-cis,cis-muconate cycloisomerase [Undibacterium sp. 5I1]
MSVSIFEHFLTTPDMIAVFDDAAIVQAMLQFEAALAKAQAAEGIIPETAARDIASVCNAQLYNIPVMVNASRRAGSLAIPLVKELTKTVALYSEESATHVHWGSTSQDVIDTAMVLATRQAISLIERDLQVLIQRLMQLAEQHLHTPILARTLMQPAQVTSFGFKLISWLAPLVRAREQLRQTATRALALQLGGAVGTLAVMGAKGPAVATRMAVDLGLILPPAAWHTQRDEWVRLGLEVAVLVGSLGKIATDLSLLAQGEIAELAEPSGKGRGGSSAMPHKRNPVSCMIALAAAARAPQRAAALLANMGQEHERGLGNWQAELAEWPGLFLSAHGAVNALSEAMAGLQVDTGRMLVNIDALQGLVFAESISIYLASVIGRPKAHSLMETLTQKAVADHTHLLDVVTEVVRNDARLSEVIDLAILQKLFDPHVATEVAAALASTQLAALRQGVASKHI